MGSLATMGWQGLAVLGDMTVVGAGCWGARLLSLLLAQGKDLGLARLVAY